MTDVQPINRRFALSILIFASSASVLSTDLYAPSLASLPAYFGTSAEAVKLTMTLNVLAYALCQLIYGPLSDRFGRRPILIAGMVAFTAAGAACALATTIEQLIAARILQGATGATQAVLVYAIIRDLFSGTERIQAMAIFGLVFGAAPAIAPLLGGYIHVYLGWRANFLVLTAIAFTAVVLIYRFLPESSRPDRHAISLREISHSYFALITNRTFVGYTILTGTSLGAIFAFLTAGPFIFINNFGVPTQAFGLYYMFMVICYMLGSLATNRAAKLVKTRLILRAGIGATLVGAVFVMWLVQSGLESPLTITIGMCFIFLGSGPVFAISPSKALDNTVNRVGYAAALIGCSELAVGGLAAAAVTVFHDESTMPLAITLVVLAIAAILLLLVADQRTE